MYQRYRALVYYLDKLVIVMLQSVNVPFVGFQACGFLLDDEGQKHCIPKMSKGYPGTSPVLPVNDVKLPKRSIFSCTPSVVIGNGDLSTKSTLKTGVYGFAIFCSRALLLHFILHIQYSN